MTKTTPATDPTVVSAVLEALLDREASYPAIARAVGLTLDELFDLLENPDMQAKIQRMQRLLDQRAALLTAENEAAAVGALGSLIELARTHADAEAKVLSARQQAEAQGDAAGADAYDNALRQLDQRFRKATEAARAARAILTHARAKARAQDISKDRAKARANARPPVRVQQPMPVAA